MHAQIFAALLQSEKDLQACETWRPPGKSQCEYGMLLSSDDFLVAPTQLRLIPVDNKQAWEEMLFMRTEIERAFGLIDPIIVKQLVLDIQEKQKRLNGQWYLAQVENRYVGEIGLIPFSFEGRLWGRLQDIDIVPAFQRLGYGTQIIQAVCQKALQLNLEGLVLMALQNDWPYRWYQKLGFQIVGDTNKPT